MTERNEFIDRVLSEMTPDVRRYVETPDPESGKHNIYGQFVIAICKVLAEMNPPVAPVDSSGHGKSDAENSGSSASLSDDQCRALIVMIRQSFTHPDLGRTSLYDDIVLTITELASRTARLESFAATAVQRLAAAATDPSKVESLSLDECRRSLRSLLDVRDQISRAVQRIR